MGLDDYGWIGLILVVFAIIVFELVVVWIVATAIVGLLGFTGLYWWATVIFVFLVLNGVLGALSK